MGHTARQASTRLNFKYVIITFLVVIITILSSYLIVKYFYSKPDDSKVDSRQMRINLEDNVYWQTWSDKGQDSRIRYRSLLDAIWTSGLITNDYRQTTRLLELARDYGDKNKLLEYNGELSMLTALHDYFTFREEKEDSTQYDHINLLENADIEERQFYGLTKVTYITRNPTLSEQEVKLTYINNLLNKSDSAISKRIRGLANLLKYILIQDLDPSNHDAKRLALVNAGALFKELGMVSFELYVQYELGISYAEERLFEKARETWNLALYHPGAKQLDHLKCQLWNAIGYLHLELGDVQTGKVYFKKVTDSLDRSSFTPEFPNYDLARINLVEASLMEGDALTALYTLHQMHEVNPSDSNSYMYALTVDQLGQLNLELEQYEEATKFLQRSLRGYTEQKTPNEAINVIVKLGDVEFKQAKYNQALEYYQQGFGFSLENVDDFAKGKIHASVGKTYIKLNRLNEAKKHLKKGLNMLETPGSMTPEMIRCKYYIAELNYKLGQLDTALFYVNEVQKQISDKNMTRLESSTHKLLFEIHKSKNLPKQALKHLKQHHNLEKKVSIINQKDEIDHMKVNFDYAAIITEKTNQSKLQEVELKKGKLKVRAYIAFLVAIFTVLFVYILRVRYRNQKVNLVRLGIERENQKNESLQQLDNQRSIILKNISTDFLVLLKKIEEELIKLQDVNKVLNNVDDYKRLNTYSESLLGLVNLMLDYSKIDEGYGGLNYTTLDFTNYVELAIRENLSKAETRNVRIKANICSDPVYINAVVSLIHGVLTILFAGLIKLTKEHSEMQVEFDVDEETLFLDIFMKEATISSDKLNEISKRYSTTKASIVEKIEPEIIGLSIVSEIFKMVRGSIVITEHNKGILIKLKTPHYSRVSVPEKSSWKTKEYIPDSRQKEENEVSEWNTPDTAETIIAIVHSDREMNMKLVTMLKKEYRVYSFFNGIDAWSSCAIIIPDIVISEIQMPNMSGFEMAKKFSTDIRTSHIPIFFIDQKPEEKLKTLLPKSGGLDYLEDPFSTDVLNFKIKNILLLRKRHKELTVSLQENVIEVDFSNVESMKSTDEIFLQLLGIQIRENISNPQINVEQLSKKHYMSRTQLYRKLKGLIGLSPSELIFKIRMEVAQELLVIGSLTTAEISNRVGYKNEVELKNALEVYREQYQTQNN